MKLPLALVPADRRPHDRVRPLQRPVVPHRRTASSRPPRPGTRRPRSSGSEDVDVTVYLPTGTTPPGGWPVAIFGHGFGNDRHVVPMTVAGTMARSGFATVAINVVGHGGGPERHAHRAPHRPGARSRCPPAAAAWTWTATGASARRRASATRAGTPLALIGSRDGLRQTVADLMQLVRAIRRGVDVDGDGHVDLDRERIVLLRAVLRRHLRHAADGGGPARRAWACSTWRAGPSWRSRASRRIFRGLVMDQLKRAAAAAHERRAGLHRVHPAAGRGAGARAGRGRARAPGLLRPRGVAAPSPRTRSAFAPYLAQAPLPGVGREAVLFQWAVGDRTVPNPTTAALLRAGELQPVSSLYRHDPARRSRSASRTRTGSSPGRRSPRCTPSAGPPRSRSRASSSPAAGRSSRC